MLTAVTEATSVTCPKCSRTLPHTLEFFGPVKGYLRRVCRECNSSRVKAWHDAHPQQRKQHKRKWVKANLDRLRAQAKRYRRERPDITRAIGLRYYYSHLDERKAAHQNERARRAGAYGTITAEDILALFAEQEGKCHYCGAGLAEHSYTIDHVIPLSRGGTNAPDNIVLTCAKCNERKGDSLPEEFEARRKRAQAPGVAKAASGAETVTRQRPNSRRESEI